VFKEVKTNLNYPENELDLVFVELPKFTKGQEELETLADKWIYFMKNARILTSIPETMDSIPEIHQAFNIANQASLSREEVEDLERREQFIYDQQGAIIKASQEGREEGMREKAIAIARQLLSRLDDETISQTTGLSVENVRNLRSNEI
jgi:predicted transposase/invertase (TIGR01784 family)